MNEFIRSDAAIALDEVTRSAGELEEVYGGLAGHLEDTGLGQVLSRHREELAEAVERLMQARQTHGDLPAGGDLERAQWKSLGMRFLALLGDEPENAKLASEVVAQCDTVATNIDNARAHDSSPDVAQALGQLADTVQRQRAALERFSPD